MSPVFLLAWRYLTYYKVRSAMLAAALLAIALLPLAVGLLVGRYNADLIARADATPLVAGAKGNRFDLIMAALYFRKARVDPVPYAEAEAILDSGLALPIPLHARFTAKGYPIVGTTPDYYDFRRLRLASGGLPALLGECALGANVARDLGIAPGGTLLSDQQNLYDISADYPLRMRVTGVFAETGTPDDDAVFADIKTAWVIEGIGHGHVDMASKAGAADVMERREGEVVASPALATAMEITPENLDSFHFHGSWSEFPLTAILCLPRDEKSATIIAGRYHVSKDYQMLVPRGVVDELVGIVLRLKRFLDANLAVVAAASAIFLGLIVWLTRQLRARERETLHRMGCGRRTVFWMFAAELAILAVAAAALASLVALAILWLAPGIREVR